MYHNCNLTEIGEPFAEQPYALAVQQGSHLQEELSRAILELQKDRRVQCTGLSKKIPAKFGDTCSVRADWLCIGCLGQWAERGRDNSNTQEFFCTTLYVLCP